MDHHPFGPSRLEQIRHCPGSYKMQLGIPEIPSAWAEEGTKLHKAVANRNTDGLNEEQTEVVQRCLGFIEEITSEGDELFFEEIVRVDKDGMLLTFGTADLIIKHASGKLTVVDWKFGYTIVKQSHENIQLAAYAAGAMQKYGAESCTCYVYQPRVKRMSVFQFSNLPNIVAHIDAIINLANAPGMNLVPSEAACRYCRARLNCPAFRVDFQKLMASRGGYDPTDPNTLDGLYTVSRTLKSFITEIETAITTYIEKNGSCGRYKFDTVPGCRKIDDLNRLYQRIADMVTPAEFNRLCSISVPKLESTMIEKIIAEAKSRGEKLSKKEAGAIVNEMISDLVFRKADTRRIVGD